jgi:hypothetical protein
MNVTENTTQEIVNAYARDINYWLARNKYTATEPVKTQMLYLLLGRDKRLLQNSGFVQAVLNNDLQRTIGYADAETMANLKLIYQAYYNIDPPVETWTPVKKERFEW